ncbi:MAG: hypothetical protein H0W99_18020 [Acidobacteria bacterium]|nr:hypothetical protein [Acidobacteriota bacterium]
MSRQQKRRRRACAALKCHEQAASIVDSWTMRFFCDDETIGDLLLLLSSIAYSRDRADRESILIAIESVLLPYSPRISTALDKLIQSRRESRCGQ